MFEGLKANILFEQVLKRPNIEKAYAMVKPTDSWFDTISKVHNALAEIQKFPHEQLEITSHDGLKLRGIYYPGNTPSCKTVIFAHGYTSHAEREWAFPGLFYHSLGFNVLIPYQRAHGISEGKYITFGALEHRDMMDWIKLINDRNPDDQILLHGLSMGGSIVLHTANKEMKNVKAIIADAPSWSIEGFFRGVTGSVFKTDWEKIYDKAVKRFKKEFAADVTDFDAVKTVAESRYPIFLCAGSNEGQEDMFGKIKLTNPKETKILILPGCDHGNGMYKQTELYQTNIKEFVNKYM